MADETAKCFGQRSTTGEDRAGGVIALEKLFEKDTLLVEHRLGAWSFVTSWCGIVRRLYRGLGSSIDVSALGQRGARTNLDDGS